MKRNIKVEFNIDLDSKKYEIKFHKTNTDNFDMDWNEIKPILKQIILGVDKQIEETGNESTEEVIKIIH